MRLEQQKEPSDQLGVSEMRSEKTYPIRIGVLGTGLMGSALARALAAAGLTVSAWNRTPTKLAGLNAMGIGIAPTIQALIEGSDLIIVCVSNYDVAESLLFQPEIAALLRGRTLVNYTSGSAESARIWGKWAIAHEIPYLDGVIMNYPQAIGQENCLIFHAGDQAAYETYKSELGVLGGQSRFVGSDHATASYLDLGLMGFYYTTVYGFMQCAASLQAAGIDPGLLAGIGPAFRPIIDETFVLTLEMIKSGSYSGSQAALNTHLSGLEIICSQAESHGVDSILLREVQRVTAEAVRRGHGNDELPAVFEVFRRPRAG